MNRKLIAGIVIVALIAGGAFAYTRFGPGTAGTQPASKSDETLPPVKAGDQVTAEGKVVPLKSATLSVAVPGTVAKVFVAEGDQVSEGQVLFRLEDSKLRASVTQAEAGLMRAEAKLAEISSGARPEEITSAQASVDAARARLVTARTTGREDDLAAAQAGVTSARAKLDQVLKGSTDADIRAAEAAVSSARAALQKAETDLSKTRNPDPDLVRQAQIDVEKAKNSLWGQYVRRDQICGLAGKNSPDCLAAKAAAAAEEGTLHTAEENLRIRQAGGKPEDVAAAQKAVESARSQLNSAEEKLGQLRRGPTSEEVAIAQAAVEQAEAEVVRVTAPPRAGTVAAAQADLQQAQAQLDLLLADAKPEVVAGAKADVASAKAALEQAKAALAEAEVRAPFTGVVATVDVRAGEQVAAGTPLMRVADISAWEIESTDLTELSVVRIQEGSPVTITFDALPGLQLPGKVTRIRAFGEKKQGDVVYTVTARPDQPDPRMRWNMTASITIPTGPEAD